MKKRENQPFSVISNFTIDDETGRLLFLYQPLEHTWIIPKIDTTSLENAPQQLTSYIREATGYHISILSSLELVDFLRNSFCGVQEDEETKIEVPFITKVVSGIPIFHQSSFAWFNIAEMVERNIDCKIIEKARFLGCS